MNTKLKSQETHRTVPSKITESEIKRSHLALDKVNLIATPSHGKITKEFPFNTQTKQHRDTKAQIESSPRDFQD